jgi:hypothetical protein
MVAQFHPGGVEGDGPGFASHPVDFAAGHKQELGLAVNKAGDQPRAGHAVDMNMGASDPAHNYVFLNHRDTEGTEKTFLIENRE